ncbi:hypothetical protein C8Q77DRAFT_1115657 [Trametes polyzona]|nr:hypothetical protein C8Q77DRAFT_1115657 [Trametes polyzona]
MGDPQQYLPQACFVSPCDLHDATGNDRHKVPEYPQTKHSQSSPLVGTLAPSSTPPYTPYSSHSDAVHGQFQLDAISTGTYGGTLQSEIPTSTPQYWQQYESYLTLGPVPQVVIEVLRQTEYHDRSLQSKDTAALLSPTQYYPALSLAWILSPEFSSITDYHTPAYGNVVFPTKMSFRYLFEECAPYARQVNIPLKASGPHPTLARLAKLAAQEFSRFLAGLHDPMGAHKGAKEAYNKVQPRCIDPHQGIWEDFVLLEIRPVDSSSLQPVIGVVRTRHCPPSSYYFY